MRMDGLRYTNLPFFLDVSASRVNFTLLPSFMFSVFALCPDSFFVQSLLCYLFSVSSIFRAFYLTACLFILRRNQRVTTQVTGHRFAKQQLVLISHPFVWSFDSDAS